MVAGSDAYRGQKLNGYFNAYGYTYQGGSLHVVFDHGPRVTARVTSTNELADVIADRGSRAAGDAGPATITSQSATSQWQRGPLPNLG